MLQTQLVLHQGFITPGNMLQDLAMNLPVPDAGRLLMGWLAEEDDFEYSEL